MFEFYLLLLHAIVQRKESLLIDWIMGESQPNLLSPFKTHNKASEMSFHASKQRHLYLRSWVSLECSPMSTAPHPSTQICFPLVTKSTVSLNTVQSWWRNTETVLDKCTVMVKKRKVNKPQVSVTTDVCWQWEITVYTFAIWNTHLPCSQPWCSCLVLKCSFHISIYMNFIIV